MFCLIYRPGTYLSLARFHNEQQKHHFKLLGQKYNRSRRKKNLGSVTLAFNHVLHNKTICTAQKIPCRTYRGTRHTPQGSHDLRYVSSGPRGLNSGLAALCCTLTTFSSHRLHHQRSFTRVIKRERERETTRTKNHSPQNHAARTPVVYSSRIKYFQYLAGTGTASVQIRQKRRAS